MCDCGVASDRGNPIVKDQQDRSKAFNDAALELIKSKRLSWRNAQHVAQWTSTLETHVCSKLGLFQVAKIDAADVIAALSPLFSKKPEAANRVRQGLEAVLDYVSALLHQSSSPKTGFKPNKVPGAAAHLQMQPISKIQRFGHQRFLTLTVPYDGIPRHSRGLVKSTSSWIGHCRV